MIDSIRSQFRVVIEKRWAVGVILLMFTLVLINFLVMYLSIKVPMFRQ